MCSRRAVGGGWRLVAASVHVVRTFVWEVQMVDLCSMCQVHPCTTERGNQVVQDCRVPDGVDHLCKHLNGALPPAGQLVAVMPRTYKLFAKLGMLGSYALTLQALQCCRG